MDIVPFTSADQEKTATFFKSIYKESGWPVTPEDGLDDLDHYFHIPEGGFLFLIKQDDMVIGAGGCVKLTAYDGLLKRFYLAHDYRGKGLARPLLEKILKQARLLSVKRVVIDVSKNNQRALRFFEKQGFTQYHPSPVEGWIESFQADTHNFYFINV